VGEHRSAWKGAADLGFDALQEVVAALNGPVPGDQDMKGDESTGSGLMSTEGMELHAGLGVLRERGLQRLLVLNRER